MHIHTMEVIDVEREKGQNVATMSCPNCGSPTPLVAMPDGGMAQSTCSNCFGTPSVSSRAVAAEGKPKREKATEVPTITVEDL